MQSEAAVKKAVIKIFRKHGVWYCCPATGGYGRSGIPDFLACVDGRFLAVETKFGGNKPTALQTRELAGISDAGGLAHVINERNLAALDNLLTELKTAGPWTKEI